MYIYDFAQISKKDNYGAVYPSLTNCAAIPVYRGRKEFTNNVFPVVLVEVNEHHPTASPVHFIQHCLNVPIVLMI